MPESGVTLHAAASFTFGLEMSDGRCVDGGVSGGAAPPILWLERGVTATQVRYIVDKLKASGSICLREGAAEKPVIL